MRMEKNVLGERTCLGFYNTSGSQQLVPSLFPLWKWTWIWCSGAVLCSPWSAHCAFLPQGGGCCSAWFRHPCNPFLLCLVLSSSIHLRIPSFYTHHLFAFPSTCLFSCIQIASLNLLHQLSSFPSLYLTTSFVLFLFCKGSDSSAVL